MFALNRIRYLTCARILWIFRFRSNRTKRRSARWAVSTLNLASSLIDLFVDPRCRSIQRDRFKNLAQKLLISSSAVGVFHASAPGSPVSAAAVLAKHPVPELSLAATTVSLINSCLGMSGSHISVSERRVKGIRQRWHRRTPRASGHDDTRNNIAR